MFRKKKKLTTDELLRFLDALIEADSSSDPDVVAHLGFIRTKRRTLDKVPYEEAMKLVDLMDRTKP